MSLLRDKVALITGSSRGIGAAIARRFALEGASVAVHGRDRAALRVVRDEIERAGGRVIEVVADVASFAEIEAMRQRIEAELGPRRAAARRLRRRPPPAVSRHGGRGRGSRRRARRRAPHPGRTGGRSGRADPAIARPAGSPAAPERPAARWPPARSASPGSHWQVHESITASRSSRQSGRGGTPIGEGHPRARAPPAASTGPAPGARGGAVINRLPLVRW